MKHSWITRRIIYVAVENSRDKRAVFQNTRSELIRHTHTAQYSEERYSGVTCMVETHYRLVLIWDLDGRKFIFVRKLYRKPETPSGVKRHRDSGAG